MRPPSAGRVTALAIAVLAGLSAARAVVFTDVTRDAGIRFRHINGASGEKFYIETMGSGACWFDADGDGDIDLYVVNSAELPGYKGTEKPTNHLYRNEGGGRFRDVTAQAGVGDRGYGMGCAVGDIDNDGDTDLYVTNFGANVLYRNDGAARFQDVTGQAAVSDRDWSASAAFADIDNDGDLDLYVTGYLDFSLDDNKFCGERKPGYRAYCHPDEYDGVADKLYRNNGAGLFEEIGAAAGIANPIGKGLGVVFTDLNGDGWQDIYVANDKTINFLFVNNHDGTFRDISMSSGVGFSESGAPQAGMGIDAGDVNGDGLPDLIVTNLDYETNELYLNNGDLTFSDATFRSGMGQPNFLNVGFGADLLDFDNDGDMDLLIVNGHILDNIELFRDQVTYAQRRSLLVNDGTGKFHESAGDLGDQFSRPGVGRGLAVGDIDNDGDLDFFVVNSNRPAQLFLNEGGNDPARGGGHWLLIRLEGTRSNRAGIGARVRTMTRDKAGREHWQTREVRSGSSYLSSNDVRLHFGLGTSTIARVVQVRWPSGIEQKLENVKADQILTIREPKQ